MAETWLINRLVEEGALNEDQKPMNSAFAWAFEKTWSGSIMEIPRDDEMLKLPSGEVKYNCRVFPSVQFFQGSAYQCNGEIYSGRIFRGARFSKLDAVAVNDSQEGDIITDFTGDSEWYLTNADFYSHFRNCFFPHMAVK